MFFDRLNTDKLLILSKFMDRFNAIPIKIPKEIEKLTLKCIGGYFPGGPVTKTQRSQSRGPRFNPWSGN